MLSTESAIQLLFSYGTLQLESVQVATFGRRLAGTEDGLPGFEESLVKIARPLKLSDYKRISVTLLSGVRAWVYVDAR
jgi:hypothetical protein